jgi:transcriptional regulator with XRE-family HTH domain
VESRTEQAIYDKMRDYVVRNDLSQRVIALNMGITESQVSLLLNGKRRLTVEDYLSFCRAISVSPTKFLPTTA